MGSPAGRVFVSYASTDKVVAEALVHALEAAGIGCWIAPRDIRPGSDYPSAILDGIRSAELMVVVVSTGSNQSKHVFREVERAVNGGLSLVPFRIADIEPSPSLEYFLSCQQWLHALPPPVDAHVGRLIDSVTAILSLRASGADDAAISRTATGVNTLRGRRVPAPIAMFTARDQLVDDVRARLAQGNLVTLVGPPGVGKTELSRAVAQTYEDGTPLLWDLMASANASSIASALAEAIGESPGLTEPELISAVSARRGLLLCDNAETALQGAATAFRGLLAEILERSPNLKILVTSRERLGVGPVEQVVRVDPLEHDDAVGVLDALLHGTAATDMAHDQESLRAVVELSDGLPLALVIAASWLSDVPASVFVEEWHRSRRMVLTLPGFAEPDRFSSLEASVVASYAALGSDARAVIHILSLLPAGASTDFLARVVSPPSLLVSISGLSRRSLVEKTATRIRLLAPIREVVAAQIPADHVTELLSSVATSLTAEIMANAAGSYDCNRDVDSSRRALSSELSNVAHVIAEGATTPELLTDLTALATAAALPLREMGRVGEGVELFEMLEQRLTNDPESRGRLVEERGHLLRAGARLHAAVDAYREALQLWVSMDRQDREAVCRLRLGDALRMLGYFSEAADEYAKGRRIHEKRCASSLGVADAIECQGDVARVSGDWSRALELYTEALTIFRGLPKGHVGVTNVTHSMGEANLALNRFAEADLYYSEAYTTAMRIGDIQGRANAGLGLAKVALTAGDLPKARSLLNRAAQDFCDCDDGLGAANAQTVGGDLAVAGSRYVEADDMYAQAEIRFTALGCPLNVGLVRVRRFLARQLGWESPPLASARAEIEARVGRRVSVQELLVWPLEKKGSVFHGDLEQI